MDPSAWLTLAVVAGCLLLLARSRLEPELVLWGGVTLLLTAGVLSPAQALGGLGNPGLATVALMYVIAAGIRETGGVEFLVSRVLGRPRGLRRAQLRLMLPTVGMSAFLNNTPVVATFIPAVLSWSRRLQLSPSRLLLPMSYAAILGGTCTLIGTSTNLVVNGLLLERGGAGLGLFEPAWVALPAVLAGLVYILLLGRRLLPERRPATTEFANPREYTVEMLVESEGPMAGKSVEQAGLRHLQGLFLVEIERGERVIASVGPDVLLQGGDRLIFAGATESVAELQQMPGLKPAESTFSLRDTHPDRCLVEVAIAPHSSLVGKSVREGRFRTLFGATVIAVARAGARVQGKVGAIRLEASDTLLIEARRAFLARHRHSRDFLLISEVEGGTPLRHHKANLAWGILAAVVLLAASGLLSTLNAALLGAGAMLATGCCSLQEARRSLDPQVLLVIAAAFGLGAALQETGAAARLAQGVLRTLGDNPWLLLAAAYVLTSILTELITNNAAAVLMFPVVTALSDSLGLNPTPFVIILMMGASASFATPIGYQTNLMVYGPGGYRFGDYLRFGLPLNLLVGVVTVAIAPFVWPFAA